MKYRKYAERKDFGVRSRTPEKITLFTRLGEHITALSNRVKENWNSFSIKVVQAFDDNANEKFNVIKKYVPWVRLAVTENFTEDILKRLHEGTEILIVLLPDKEKDWKVQGNEVLEVNHLTGESKKWEW